MKKILISLISTYQKFISPLINNILGVNEICRFSPTCSEYTKQMVRKHGMLGIILGAKRIGACR